MIYVSAFDRSGIRGFLHHAAVTDGRGLVLTHGAGGNCASPLLIAAADAFARVGLTVLRCDLPFRQRRASGPPAATGAATDRAGLKSALQSLRALMRGPLWLGGQSYGGRQASILAAEEPELEAGLLLLSYPLHPPGKPDRPRTEHFSRLRTPAVFVHGTIDPFGAIAEIGETLPLIQAPTILIQIEGAGHDLNRGRFDWTAVAGALQRLGFSPHQGSSEM